MKIGIKYCGGCNSHYDRIKAVTQLLPFLAGHAVTYHPAEDGCDICLYVSGCHCACATTTAPIAATYTFDLRSPEQFQDLLPKLQDILRQT